MKHLLDVNFFLKILWLRFTEYFHFIVGDLSYRIASPSMTTINTTAISVGITSTSYLYPKDRWSPDGRYEIKCYEYYGKRLLLDTFHLNGSIPQWATLTGLQNYTLYKCYAFHFGLLDGKVKFHVMSSYGLRYSGSNGKINLVSALRACSNEPASRGTSLSEMSPNPQFPYKISFLFIWESGLAR